MNAKKIGSPHLDTPSSRYNFYKFAFKHVKINHEKHFKNRLTAGTRGSTGPTRQRHIEQGRGLTVDKLVDGKVTDGEVTRVVFPSLLHTYTLVLPSASPERPRRRAWWLGGGTRWRTRHLR